MSLGEGCFSSDCFLSRVFKGCLDHTGRLQAIDHLVHLEEITSTSLLL